MPGLGRVGDVSQCPADAHGCPLCPHPAAGPAAAGSPDVTVNGLPALRVGDKGAHIACCGPNTWEAVVGSATVTINGKPAHRMGDLDRHCGGVGTLQVGSPNVNVGGASNGPSASAADSAPTWIEVELVDEDGRPLSGASYELTTSDGKIHKGTVPDSGVVRLEEVPPGASIARFAEVRASLQKSGAS